jgi:hypothetical protein
MTKSNDDKLDMAGQPFHVHGQNRSLEDPHLLLEGVPLRADRYLLLEKMLLDSVWVEYWSDIVRAARAVAASSKDLFPASSHAPQQMSEADIERKVHEIIQHGLGPAVADRLVTDNDIRALLSNPDALIDAHVRLWTSDSPYWQTRIQAIAVGEKQPPSLPPAPPVPVAPGMATSST